MKSHLSGAALLLALPYFCAAALSPLVCPAGGPIGSVDLRVAPGHPGHEPLPLRNINRLEEGDVILYHPLLRPNESRKGEVAIVLVPANKSPDRDRIVVLEAKPADQPQQWSVPERVSVVAYVYGPSGLSRKKVKEFLSRDDELVAELADYAEKTAQTEALIAALSSPNNSDAVQSALTGFSSAYGVTTQIDRTAPTDQQALVLLRTINPAVAAYDPISPQGTQQLGQTAGLATSVAALFFGSPVGLAAGGTVMLLQLRAIAFPNSQFRSSFAQTLPGDGLGLCGKRDAAPPHTKVAYIWASRVPNVGPPSLAIDKENSIPAALKSAVPITAGDPDWKYVERARSWALQPDDGKPVPIKVQKLGNAKKLELDLGPAVRAGRYRLVADWDWDPFTVGGHVDVRPLSDFKTAKLAVESQDMLVAKTGKVPVCLQGSDFEFVTKVAIERVGDIFATPAPVPFVLPEGPHHGPQDHIELQVNTAELDAGPYKLLIEQLDGKAHPVNIKLLPAPPQIDNLPIILNQGVSARDACLKGRGLDQLTHIEIANGRIELGSASRGQTDRALKVLLTSNIAAGTSLAMKAYVQDRSEPLTLSDAVRIVGPRPRIAELVLAAPPKQDVQLDPGELPGGVYLSAMMRVHQLQSNSVLNLSCKQPATTVVTLHLGERAGPLSLQQLTPDQIFFSFDTGAWLNGCELQATIANGNEGESDPYAMGHIVRVPKIEKFDGVTLTGENLETIEKVGWIADSPIPVVELPLPLEGQASKQTLHVSFLPSPPAPDAPMFVWLRGETKPRTITLAR